jgi:hypothetical protein
VIATLWMGWGGSCFHSLPLGNTSDGMFTRDNSRINRTPFLSF